MFFLLNLRENAVTKSCNKLSFLEWHFPCLIVYDIKLSKANIYQPIEFSFICIFLLIEYF